MFPINYDFQIHFFVCLFFFKNPVHFHLILWYSEIQINFEILRLFISFLWILNWKLIGVVETWKTVLHDEKVEYSFNFLERISWHEFSNKIHLIFVFMMFFVTKLLLFMQFFLSFSIKLKIGVQFLNNNKFTWIYDSDSDST